MRGGNKNTVFIVQYTGRFLKVLKCLRANKQCAQFIGFELIELSPDQQNDPMLIEKINKSFQRLAYKGESIIVSLLRSQVTCRYLRIPANTPEEIDKIVSLQAPRHLPYPSNELIVGYNLILSDKEGYSDINLIIAHNQSVRRLINLFKRLNSKNISIVLSSYGLTHFCDYIQDNASSPVMLLDIGSDWVEFVVSLNKRLVFSRYFKLDRTILGWEDSFIDQIDKSGRAYLKEMSLKGAVETPKRLVVISSRQKAEQLVKALNTKTEFEVEVISNFEKIIFTDELENKVMDARCSFVSLLGLGATVIEPSLNLVPQELKLMAKKSRKQREYFKIGGLVIATLFAFGLASWKNLDNKFALLNQLRQELRQIAKDSRPLDHIDKKLKLIKAHQYKGALNAEILYQLHQAIPRSATLFSFNYQKDRQLVIRGQAQELNSVFSFVSKLEGSSAFRPYDIKVRYASQKKTDNGEMVNFEIIGVKSK